MEVNINHEIREYRESMFFGLSIRQVFFSLLAVVSAVVIYFTLEPKAGAQITSWFCVLAAIPSAAMGFVRYHGMNCEQFVWAWIRCRVIEPKRFVYRANNYYYEAMRESVLRQRKEAMKCHERSEEVREESEG